MPQRAANYLMDTGRTRTHNANRDGIAQFKQTHKSLEILVDLKSDATEAQMAIKLTR